MDPELEALLRMVNEGKQDQLTDDQKKAAEDAKKKADEEAAAKAGEANLNQMNNLLGNIQFNTAMQGEISDYFNANPALARNPQIRQAVINSAIQNVKSSWASGKQMSLGEALKTTGELSKTQLVEFFKAAGPQVREFLLEKSGDKRSEFVKKMDEYTPEQFFNEYAREIMPALTVKGLNAVYLEKGYGKDIEKILKGTADHFKRVKTA